MRRTRRDCRYDATRHEGTEPVTNRILVTVSGLTGSGKSRITHEIETALIAAGVKVEWIDPDDRRQADVEADPQGCHPDMPEVLLQEMNVPRRIREGMQTLTGQHSAPVFETYKGVSFFAKDSDGNWHYVNHAWEWQGCPPPFPEAAPPSTDLDAAPTDTDILLWGRWDDGHVMHSPTWVVGQRWSNGGGWRVIGNTMSTVFRPLCWAPVPLAPANIA
jgi:hypothetical protein